MKNLFLTVAIFSVFLLAVGCSSKGKQNNSSSADGLSGEIQLSGAFALYPMAVKWASEFQKVYPNVRIDISAGGAGKGMTDALAKVVDLGMVSREVYAVELEKGAFPIAVTKDAVVPIVNINNPAIDEIKAIGLTRENALKLWVDGAFTTWGQLLGTSSKVPLNVYTRSDACGAAETWAAWFEKKQEDLGGTAVYADPGVSGAVQKDKAAVGYCNVAYAYDQKTKKPFKGITPLPLDVDGNGTIDENEYFYDNVEELMAAIGDGRYPSPPARDLYLVSNGKPTDPVVVEFIKFILNEGQQWTAETGYIALPQSTIERELSRMEN